MRKKTVSLFLIGILSFEMATPLLASDLFDGYQSGSSPKQWTDGGGGKYMYGGDFTYRFKRNTVFKPLLEIKPPGIKAGCNGISISGGFIHFLGLDEIKEQLQSASEGAMMGVVVGIVYSLPGIADAFDKVQKYVRLLQQILSQSCQMSAKYTKDWIDSQRKAANAPGGSAGSENAMGQLFNKIDNWADTLNKGDDLLEEKVLGIFKTTDLNATSNDPTHKSMLQCNQTCQIARKNASADFKTFVETNSVAGSGKTYADGTISQLNQIVKNDERKRALEFQMIFVGYDASSEIPEEMSKENYAKLVVQNLKTGGLPISKTEHQRGLFYDAVNINGESAVSILMNGTPDGIIKMPKIGMRVYYTDGKNADGSYADRSYAVLFKPVSAVDSADIQGYEYPWKGLVKEGVVYLTDVVNGVTPAPAPTIPTVFPGMKKYVQILRTQFKSNPASGPFVENMISYLAQRNAVMLLQSIIFETQNTLDGKNQAEDKQQSEVIAKLQEEVDRINKSSTTISEAVSIFEKLEREHDAGITGGIKR